MMSIGFIPAMSVYHRVAVAMLVVGGEGGAVRDDGRTENRQGSREKSLRWRALSMRAASGFSPAQPVLRPALHTASAKSP